LPLHGNETAQFAARPVIAGRHMVVACGHWLAAMAGMRMLDRGGNAFDAGVAIVFAQAVLEFQSYGFGGEVPMLLYPAAEGRVVAVSGNMTAPAAATIEEYRRRGVTDLIPGDCLLAAGVCAVPDALIAVLDRYGTLSLREVLEPAIQLAADGFPVYPGLRDVIVQNEARLRAEWPTSAALLLPDGRVPEVGETWRNPDLARTFEKLVEAEQAALARGRSGALQATRDRFYRGDIARQIVRFQRENRFRDENGIVSNGLLTEADFAAFATRFEEPTTVRYRGLDVFKCGPWSQGPVLLQMLNLLEPYDLRSMGQNSADYIHTILEAMKLAYADRERYYGDPDFVDVPLSGLLSPEYAAARRALIDPHRASLELRPGNPYPYQGSDFVPDLSRVIGRPWSGGTTSAQVIDRDGNVFSAIPSGGWFRSSPVIEGLGFCLGTRMQMFWLGDPDHPGALRPGKRPRTTLTPSLVLKDGRPFLAFGTPGLDQQDQWSLLFFLGVADFGLDVQEAIEAPVFHSHHFPKSWYPRLEQPGVCEAESRIEPEVIDELRRRGHTVNVAGPWAHGFVTAVMYDAQRRAILGGASPRNRRSYALGW
jgi:gamma-glutamyltranspeptidase / glutathione hydrolase